MDDRQCANQHHRPRCALQSLAATSMYVRELAKNAGPFARPRRAVANAARHPGCTAIFSANEHVCGEGSQPCGSLRGCKGCEKAYVEHRNWSLQPVMCTFTPGRLGTVGRSSALQSLAATSTYAKDVANHVELWHSPVTHRCKPHGLRPHRLRTSLVRVQRFAQELWLDKCALHCNL